MRCLKRIPDRENRMEFISTPNWTQVICRIMGTCREMKKGQMEFVCLGINSLGGRSDPRIPFATATAPQDDRLDRQLVFTELPFPEPPHTHSHTHSQWAGFLGHPAIPAKPQPPTAAASHQTERVARAAGKAAICSSHAWTRTTSWMASKRMARHDRSAPRRLRSSRKLAQRAGYVLGYILRSRAGGLEICSMLIRCRI